MPKQLKNGEIAMEGINCPPQGDIVMTIVITAQGEFKMMGPMQNKLLSYAMLEMARDNIASYVAPDPLAIQPANEGMLRGLPRGAMR